MIDYYENLNEMNVVGLMHVSDANHEGLECQGKKIHERTALLIFFHTTSLHLREMHQIIIARSY